MEASKVTHYTVTADANELQLIRLGLFAARNLREQWIDETAISARAAEWQAELDTISAMISKLDSME